MANYEALMQELKESVDETHEANIMRQLVQTLKDFNDSPFTHAEHERTSSKVLTNTDMRWLKVPKLDVDSIILPLLNPHEDPTIGFPVVLYGKDGSGCVVSFQFWSPSVHVLCGEGWRNFVKSQGLQEDDTITLWLFKTRHPTNNHLRFALTAKCNPNTDLKL